MPKREFATDAEFSEWLGKANRKALALSESGDQSLNASDRHEIETALADSRASRGEGLGAEDRSELSRRIVDFVINFDEVASLLNGDKSRLVEAVNSLVCSIGK